MEIANTIGAVVTILMGCLGLFFPAKAMALTGLAAATAPARAEFRGTLGVTFIFLGLVPLMTQNPYAFLTVGVCWLGAAIGRVISIFVDDGNEPKNWAAVGIEGFFAALLLVGQPYSVLFATQ
jgi:hypothetical protein